MHCEKPRKLNLGTHTYDTRSDLLNVLQTSKIFPIIEICKHSIPTAKVTAYSYWYLLKLGYTVL